MVAPYHSLEKKTYENKYNKYKSKYLTLKGGDSEKSFEDNFASKKLDELTEHLGEPTHMEHSNGKLTTVTWKTDLNDYEEGKFKGLDMIKLYGVPGVKYHPVPAPVYLIAGKFMHVPEHLFGPIKYASETINIEQIFTPKEVQKHYKKTGEKKLAMVTGSCASVIISSITIKFVEDMIKKYKGKKMDMKLYKIFRDEYDKRILGYLCGKGVNPPIGWFNAKDVGESDYYKIKSDKCRNL